MPRLTNPLKIHGGKYYMAPQIVARFPRHRHYVEPYFGGGSVLLYRDPDDPRLQMGTSGSDRGVSELVNDVDRRLTNFWTVLQHPQLFREMHRRLQCVPLSRWEWNDARDWLEANPISPDVKADVDYACAFFVLCRQSLAGRVQEFTSITRGRTRRGMNGNVSEYLGAIEGMPAVHARMIRVVVENMDGAELAAREDAVDTFQYVDPPYLPKTRTSPKVYAHEMNVEQHVDLLDVLGGLKGKFLLSGYDSDLYRAAEKKHGWNRVEIKRPNQAAGGKKKREMTEVIWSNY